MTLRLEPLDLRGVVDDAVETTRPLVMERRHRVVVRLPEQPVHVMGDRVRLTQVVDNILTNAVKYTDEGGDIEIVLEAPAPRLHMVADDGSADAGTSREDGNAANGGTALIRVRDTGRGIAPKSLPEIFQLFHRIDVPHERPHAGLGIGLAVSRGLVEMHNGRIEALSEGLTRGSEFVVRLPLADRR